MNLAFANLIKGVNFRKVMYEILHLSKLLSSVFHWEKAEVWMLSMREEMRCPTTHLCGGCFVGPVSTEETTNEFGIIARAKSSN